MEIVPQSIKTPQKMSQFQVFANPGRKGNVCAGDAETDTITRMMMMYSLSRNASLMSIVGPVGKADFLLKSLLCSGSAVYLKQIHKSSCRSESSLICLVV